MPDNADIGGQSTPPLVNVADGRAVVRLNRPREHNRLEPTDLTLLRETFDRIDADPSVRVLVVTATGKSFSSGFHIGALADRLAGKASSRSTMRSNASRSSSGASLPARRSARAPM